MDFEKNMPLLAKYLRCVKRNPKKYKCIVAAVSAVAGIGSVAAMAISGIAVGISVLCGLVPFLTLLAVLLPLPPFYSSLFWQQRVMLFLLLGVMQTLLSRWFIAVACSVDALRPDIPIWLLIWLVVPVAVWLTRFLNARCVRAITTGTKRGRFYLKLRDIALVLSLHRQREKRAEAKRFPLSAVFFFLASCLCILLVGGAIFLDNAFSNMGLDAVIFTIRFASDANRKTLLTVAAVLSAVAAAALLTAIYYVRKKNTAAVVAHSLDKTSEKRVDAPVRNGLVLWVMQGILLAASIAVFVGTTGIIGYLRTDYSNSLVYEELYIKPVSEIIHFPEQKKNLLYIYLESMENTFADYESGGNNDVNYIPEITELEQENVNFSHTGSIGGATIFPSPLSYTMGSTVAQTGGVPLQLFSLAPVRMKLSYMGVTVKDDSIELPGLRRLEDILHDEGYRQLFLLGASAQFACYDTFVGRYEDSVIFDRYSAEKEGYIANSQETEWGLLDKTLYGIAKEKLSALAAGTQPFCMTMYTMDTHGLEGGVRCPLCDPAIENNFAASVRCASKQLGDFIKWVQEQSFYQDTVIILVGDHPAETVGNDGGFLKTSRTYKQDFFGNFLYSDYYSYSNEDSSYKRSTVCCIINSGVQPVREKYRVFSTPDMFPTTLAALGVKIDGERLGFGTNLFSDRQTLCEEKGAENFAEYMNVSPQYYWREFWKIG